MKQRLELLRDEKDMLRKDVARDFNVVESVYSEWENDKLQISTKRLVEFSNYYKVNIDYILNLTNTRITIKKTNNIDLIKIGSNLKTIRKELKLSMNKFANKFHTTPSAICYYENGKYLIASHLLIEIAKASNYSIDWILGLSNDKFIK